MRGLNSHKKQQMLQTLLHEHKPDVLHLQETKLTRKLGLAGSKTLQTTLNRKGGCLTAMFNGDRQLVKALNRTIVWSIIKIRGTPLHFLNVYIDPVDKQRALCTMQQIIDIVRYLTEKTGAPRITIAGDYNHLYNDFKHLAATWHMTPVLPEDTITHNRGGALD